MRLFLLYAMVELTVMVVLASTIGFGWMVLLLLATFLLGLALAGSQVKRHIQRLQSGLTATGPRGQRVLVTDSVLVALGTVLVVVPGLASTLLGSLFLLPPTRAAVRPLVTAMAARRVALINVDLAGTRGYPSGHGDYIDGEVIDVVDNESIAVERKPE